ncbi:TlpA family protein disulfide reductase [Thermanaerothrix daxensis]|uniref:TlpA family protein disulfide reductase n=1 Tax=Thermanaerothrix daxensis TaxID=869279 RepID=UPI0006C8E87E|nr:TlpA disulfide reductase family protein [Thermanaerothrix daxensis]
MSTESKPTTGSRSLSPVIIVVSFVLLIGFLYLIGQGLRRAYAGPIAIGQKVPAFELTTFEGAVIRTADWQGKVIVVNFWASWCKPCEQEAADLEQAWQRYRPGGEVLFLGVDYVDTEPEARAFIEKFGLTYPNGPDLRTKISQMFRIQGVPETYIIDRGGRLAFVKKGPTTLNEITGVIDQLLAQAP